jgi:hypothetical protein
MIQKFKSFTYVLVIIELIIFLNPDLKSQINKQPFFDSIENVIQFKKIYFNSDGYLHPFSFRLGTDRYFIKNDIKFGSMADTNQVMVVWLKESMPQRTIVEKVDTLNNYFTINVISTNISHHSFRNTLNGYKTSESSSISHLTKELEYSYLLSKAGKSSLLDSGHSESLRIILPSDVSTSVNKFLAIRIDFFDDYAQIVYSVIDTQNSLNINTISSSVSLMRKSDLRSVHKRMSKIDFPSLPQLQTVNEYYDSENGLEFLVEYLNHNQYYVGIVPNIWFDVLSDNSELRKNIRKLVGELLRMSNNYQR